MRALLGEPGGVKEGSGDGHLFPWGSRWETWERVHIAPLGNLRRGVHLPWTLRLAEGGLWLWSISLYGSSVRGTWRGEGEGLLCWGPCSLWKKDAGDGHLSSWGLSCATWSGLTYQGLWEMVERGYGRGAFLSMRALWKEPGRRASLLWTLEDR